MAPRPRFGEGWSILADRQRTNSNSCFLDDHHATCFQCLGCGGEIRHEKRHLPVRAAVCSASKQDDRRLRFLSQRKHCTEVGIGGDNDAAFRCCQQKYRFVVGRLQVSLSQMHGIVAVQAQRIRNAGR